MILYDMYQSDTALYCIIPLAGCVDITVSPIESQNHILITAQRPAPMKQSIAPLQQQCYRGDISLTIDMPPGIIWEDISWQVTKTSVCEIIIPYEDVR